MKVQYHCGQAVTLVSTFNDAPFFRLKNLAFELYLHNFFLSVNHLSKDEGVVQAFNLLLCLAITY